MRADTPLRQALRRVFGLLVLLVLAGTAVHGAASVATPPGPIAGAPASVAVITPAIAATPHVARMDRYAGPGQRLDQGAGWSVPVRWRAPGRGPSHPGAGDVAVVPPPVSPAVAADSLVSRSAASAGHIPASRSVSGASPRAPPA
ncbi:hypothetical protein ACFFWC_02510 [Plantactinospora siamensis]|uniref:Uncharacterized protein n=1 Tax=Plantactinospora siamensis TaxID=555372 RepID=A0ABV6NSL8_9ACTN